MKIKLCIATSALSNQGPPNVIYNILKYLNYDEFSVSIITMAPEKEISRMDDFRKLPIEIYQIAPNGLKNGISLGWAFRKKLKDINPDIVHVHCPRSVLLSFLIPRTCIRMVTIHNFPELSQIIYGKYKGRLIKHLRMMMTKRIEYRVACSESIAERYVRLNLNTTAIPNGCSLPIWNYDSYEKQLIKAKLGLDDKRKWFLFIGGFVEGKNPALVIKAFESFKDDNYGVVLLGDGYLYADLKRHETERILLPGFRSNIYDYVKACDYYISSSSSEGMPNALLECMSAGLPSVLSNIPAHKEVLAKSNQSLGSLFNLNDISSIVSAIQCVISMDIIRTSKVVKEVYARYYTAEKMSKQYQQYYKDIYANKNLK